MLHGVGDRHKTIIISLAPFYNVLGVRNAASLPGFHTLSGADVTGRFAGKAILKFWQALCELARQDDIVRALSQLGVSRDTIWGHHICHWSVHLQSIFASHVLYKHSRILRWWLFKGKQAQPECLPPTRAALEQAVLRTPYQDKIWNNNVVPHHCQHPPNYGWETVDGTYQPVMTTLPPSRTAVINLVKFGCSHSLCAPNRCKCRQNGLNFTYLCGCCETDEFRDSRYFLIRWRECHWLYWTLIL